MDSARASAPSWLRRHRVVFAAEVGLEEDLLVDRVAAQSFESQGATRRLLRRIAAGTTLGELEALEPGSWPLVLRMNAHHLVNVEGPCAFDPREHCIGVARRKPLGGSPASWACTRVSAALGRTLSNPWLAGSLALVCAGWVAWFGGRPAEVAGVVALALAGYALHEWGHARLALSLGLPAYVLSDPSGVSVWARAQTSREARLFALAGPAVPVAVGLLALAVCSWTGDRNRVFLAFPFLVHLVALTPLCHDGRILIRGRRST